MDNDVKEQVLMGFIDFNGHEDMFESMKEYVRVETNLKKFIIFNEEEPIVWITWYDNENLE